MPLITKKERGVDVHIWHKDTKLTRKRAQGPWQLYMPCSVSSRSETGTWKQKRLTLPRPKTNSITGTTVTDKEGGAQILSFGEGRRGKWGNVSDPASGTSLLLPFLPPHFCGHGWALLPVALSPEAALLSQEFLPQSGML